MENTNQRIKQKALCWFRKSGVYNIVKKRAVTKGLIQQYRQGNDQNNSRSYDVSIIAYWKKPNGYIET